MAAEFAPTVLFQIGSFPVTNTVLGTLVVDGALLTSAYYIKNHIKKIPGLFQNLLELVLSTFYDLTEQISGKNVAKIFPWFATFFLFILVANVSGLMPGTGSIGLKETVDGKEHLVPIIRNATSDINVTLGLAIVSLIATHILAVRSTGFKDYISRFISFNPILLFVGVLEIVSEFTKIVSLSFRLFGNIFAGEVVLTTISGLLAFFAPIPFLMLEVIVALVQALVFAMLTMVFMSVLMTPHHSDH